MLSCNVAWEGWAVPVEVQAGRRRCTMMTVADVIPRQCRSGTKPWRLLNLKDPRFQTRRRSQLPSQTSFLTTRESLISTLQIPVSR